LTEHVVSVRNHAIGVEPWNDALAGVTELTNDPSSSAVEHLSFLYALKYAR
jgi:hypothetical protein